MASEGRDYCVVLACDVDLRGAVKVAPLVAGEVGLDDVWMAQMNHVAYEGLDKDGLDHGVEKAPLNSVAAGAVDHHDDADTAPMDGVAGSIGHREGLDVAPMEHVPAGDLLGVAAIACLDAACETAADLADGTGLLDGVVYSMDWVFWEVGREDVGCGLDPTLVAALVSQNEGWFPGVHSW